MIDLLSLITEPDSDSVQDIKQNLEEKSKYGAGRMIRIGMGSCGIEKGALNVLAVLTDELRHLDIQDVSIGSVGCLGWCSKEVILTITERNQPTFFYGNITDDKIPKLVSEHIINKRPIKDWIIGITGNRNEATEDIPILYDVNFFREQNQLVSRNCGFIDPESIEEYILSGGFVSLQMALRDMKKEDIIEMLIESKLVGRGGSGVSTGHKWSVVASAKDSDRYLICNAHEGESTSFKDRRLMESDPFRLIEGITIASFAISAKKAYIYINPTYTLAHKRLTKAIELSKKHNLLGENILSTDFSLDIVIRKAPSLFFCGEETMLINFLEGKTGARQKPPELTEVGLWGKPTVVNNVETLMNLPPLVFEGIEWLTAVGTASNPGTKNFTLSGSLNNTGIVEVPMGTALGEVINQIGGGAPEGQKLKAFAIGGVLGGILPANFLTTTLDYPSLARAGIFLNTGSICAIPDTVCIVDWLKKRLRFLTEESCGQCTPCRDGTYQAEQIVNKIASGNATEEDLKLLNDIGNYLKISSLCAYGQNACNSIITSLRYFRNEFKSHIEEKFCPAGVCKLE